MKRTTTLLALVALVIAFLALQSVQSPARSTRHRATVPAQSNERTQPSDIECAPAPGVKAGRASGEDPASTSAACDPAEQEILPQEQPPISELSLPGRQEATEPATPQTSAPNTEEEQPKKQLTPEEEELAQKRGERRPALNWLRDHQCEDGRWSASDFGAASTRKEARHTFNVEFFAPGLEWGDKGQSPDNDLVVTALVLLCHVGSGLDLKGGDYKENVRKALIWLRKQQHESGRFGEERDNGFLPTHALCAAALAECYGLSGDAALKKTCESALAYLLTLQTKESGFARRPDGYGLEAEPDVATTAWSALAVKSAQMSGIEMDLDACGKGIRSFLNKVTTVMTEREDGGAVEAFTKLRASGGDSPDGRLGGFVEMPTLNAMNAFVRGLFGPFE